MHFTNQDLETLTNLYKKQAEGTLLEAQTSETEWTSITLLNKSEELEALINLTSSGKLRVMTNKPLSWSELAVMARCKNLIMRKGSPKQFFIDSLRPLHDEVGLRADNEIGILYVDVQKLAQSWIFVDSGKPVAEEIVF